MALTETEIRILNYVEQVWWEAGGVPTNERLIEDLAVTEDQIKNFWKKPIVTKALAARGIELADADPSKGILTTPQIIMANMLLNLEDKRSTREKLKELSDAVGEEISTQKLAAWRRQPAFNAYLTKRAEELFKGSDPDAYAGLVQLVKQNDLGAIKTYFEMRGIYNPKVTVDVNVGLILTKIVEIVSRHVTDPEILEAIAEDVEKLEIEAGVGANALATASAGRNLSI